MQRGITGHAALVVDGDRIMHLEAEIAAIRQHIGCGLAHYPETLANDIGIKPGAHRDAQARYTRAQCGNDRHGLGEMPPAVRTDADQQMNRPIHSPAPAGLRHDDLQIAGISAARSPGSR